MGIVKGSTTNTPGTNRFVLFSTDTGAADSGYIGSNGANNAAFFATSDARKKENIVSLPAALDKILEMRPVSYKWKDSDDIAVGFIAQEMSEILPAVVNSTDNGTDPLEEGAQPWSMTESGFVPYLVKAIQELSAKNDALNARLAALE